MNLVIGYFYILPKIIVKNHLISCVFHSICPTSQIKHFQNDYITDPNGIGRSLKSHSCNCLRETDVGSSVRLRGFVAYIRNKFLLIRDSYGMTQILIPEQVTSNYCYNMYWCEVFFFTVLFFVCIIFLNLQFFLKQNCLNFCNERNSLFLKLWFFIYFRKIYEVSSRI